MQKRTTRELSYRNILPAALSCLLWAAPMTPVARADVPTTRPVAPTTRPITGPDRDPQFHVDMKQMVTYLASDALEGRRVGTPGARMAADRIADTFSKLGLQTLPGLNGYFQPFSMITRVDPDPSKTSLTIGDWSLKMGEEFQPLRASAEGSAAGEVVFAGYGITDSVRHYDDYAKLDVKGKIVLVMRFEPQDKDGKSRFAGKDEDWSIDATIPQKVRTAVERGAAGVILVNPALHHDDEGLIPFARRYPFGAKVPVVQVSVAAADAMLKLGGAHDLKTLQSKIDGSPQPDGAALKGVTARLSFGLKETKAQVQNVAALLPGQGPHADEYVVIGGHYDHLGHGGPGSLAPWSHGIHHGADDNASGTTAMLELADRFAHLGPQPRSLVFIAFTGEEEGLIGSQYFVSHSPIPLDKVVAMLNLDMVGRLQDEKLLIGGEGTAAVFPDLVTRADKSLPLVLGEFGQGGIGPSDHTSFALKKIPVLFFFTGLHLDYHRPTDTADKINYRGMEQIVGLGENVVKQLATMSRQPYDGSHDAGGLLQLTGPKSDHAGGRASMGAIPDYSQGEDAKGGMRIGGIMPGSPAEKVGLRAGDLIADFNGTPINNMIDYTAALGKAKPGEKVTLKVIRDGKPLRIEATLVGRKD